MELHPVKLKQLLLVEPQSLFRRTLATVARQLKLADVVEASSYEAAQSLLEAQRFDGLMLAMGDGVASLNLLQDLRMGKTRNTRVLPLAVSRVHLLILRDERGCIAYDVASMNGTKHRGKSVRSAILSDTGSDLLIGGGTPAYVRWIASAYRNAQ